MASRNPTPRPRALRSLLVLVLLVAPGTFREARSDDLVPVPRTILALVDGGPDGFETDREDEIQQLLELPLNQLGMTVIRHDVRKGPPPASALKDLRAVLTCFEYSEEPVDWLWPFLEERRRAGTRILIVNEFGPLEAGKDGKGAQRIASFLAPFGLGYDDNYVELPLGVEKELLSEELCAYEADPRGCTVHRGPFLTDETRNRAWVKTRCPTEDARTRVPVVTGPWGAIALSPWVYHDTDVEGARRWYVDPFAFFREALGLEGVPAPHPCVLNGRRMYFCHVDGDGFESFSTARNGKLCGEAFLPEIVEKFELPITISVIVASLTDDIDPPEPTRAMRAASKLLMHPRVEAATHTVLHPFDWAVKPGMPFPLDAAFTSLKNYVSSPEAEVRESVRFINEKLLTDGKRCDMVLWSGDATPPLAALREADRIGCLNLNGGVYRWDAMNDSVGYVSPWGRRLEECVQVYCGAPNENVYEGYFDTQPASFAQVRTPLERTAKGRILKPANIYVHFYSVEQPTRMAVFQRLLKRWGQEEETAPVFTSVYAAAGRDAELHARIFRAPGGWAFRDFGACRTVRFDGPTERIDWDASPGVLGARRIGDALYLSLGASDARVTFRKDAPDRLHLIQANHVLTDVVREPDRIACRSRSVAPRFFEFGGLPAGATVEVIVDGKSQAKTADAEGKVEFRLRPGESDIEVIRK